MLRRPPSYSDSFLVLGDQTPLEPLMMIKNNEPLLLVPDTPRVDRIGSLNSGEAPQPIEIYTPLATPENPWPKRIAIFVLKSSIHVFLISVFETIFFFYYVSVTENTGIVKTIDTYYKPIQEACPSWGNLTQWVLYKVLEEVNVSHIDSRAAEALAERNTFNYGLFMNSLTVSGVCLGIFIGLAILMRFPFQRHMRIPWLGICIENCMMVVLLGMYEYFFFRVIIYNYDTLSTQELNAHIVDGLWQCVQHEAMNWGTKVETACGVFR